MANFIEIESYCKKELLDNLNDIDRQRKQYERSSIPTYFFSNTYYIAIDENEEIIISQTPHILQSAYRCVIIYRWQQLAKSQYYDTYKCLYIDEFGGVHYPIILDYFKIGITDARFNEAPKIILSFINRTLISVQLYPLEMTFKFIWNLCKLCKGKTYDEAVAICSTEAKRIGIE